MKMWIGILNLFLLSYVATAQQLGSQHVAAINFGDNITTPAEVQSAETAFSRPGWLPTHPLYFAKRLRERIRLLASARAGSLHLEFAQTRLSEAGAMMRQGNSRAAAEALAEFRREMREAWRAGARDEGWLVEKSILFLGATDAPPEIRPDIEKTMAMLRGSA